MSRSNWKPVFFDPKLWNLSSSKTNNSSQTPFEQDLICTKRATPVASFIVGRRIHIANGIRLVPATITAEIVGHRRGEFSATRKRSAINIKQSVSAIKK